MTTDLPPKNPNLSLLGYWPVRFVITGLALHLIGWLAWGGNWGRLLSIVGALLAPIGMFLAMSEARAYIRSAYRQLKTDRDELQKMYDQLQQMLAASDMRTAGFRAKDCGENWVVARQSAGDETILEHPDKIAEILLHAMGERGKNLRRIAFYHPANDWCELVHDGKTFLGIKPLDEAARAEIGAEHLT